MLTNDVVSFEQLGPVVFKTMQNELKDLQEPENINFTTVLGINFLAGSKYLLHSVKVGPKLTYLVAKFGGHITAHLPSVKVVFRFKTKQNPIWSKALTMPLTIWDFV